MSIGVPPVQLTAPIARLELIGFFSSDNPYPAS
jgi:hypothetical protein